MGRITIAGIIAMLLVGGAWLFALPDDSRSQAQEAEQLALETGDLDLLTTLKTTDRDGDSLADWEEALRGTNPEQPDSDGDGSNDHDEIRAGRNPLKAGPNDAVAPPPQTMGESAAAFLSEESRNATDRLALELFANYARDKRSGATDFSDPAFVSSIANQYSTQQIPRYTRANLVVDSNETSEVLAAYKSDLDKIVIALFDVSEYELFTLVRALYLKDNEELQKLAHAEGVYGKAREHLLAMRVPESALPMHMQLLNSIAALELAVAGMQQALLDPITGAASVNTFTRSEASLQSAFSALALYVQQKGLAPQTTS